MKESDEDTVDKWVSYLESKPRNEKGKKIVDQFSYEDVEDPFYNAVHYAIVENKVTMFEKLCSVGAGAYWL